jgi:DtxR family Mn-dependent transcriptional regulator
MNTTEPITQNIQDYLKHIYTLTAGGETASTTALAARLGIAPASVTGMVQKLAAAKPALVKYRKHQGVTLTEAGRRAALEVIRHHRLIETYLVTMLGYSWDSVHDEACKLEHFISEEFEARIAAAMGNPMRDPHGELIPTEDLVMPDDPSTPLSALEPGQHGDIQRVGADEPAFLRHLEELGLAPGAQVTITATSPFDNNTTLRVGTAKQTIVVGPPITSKVFVQIKE